MLTVPNYNFNAYAYRDQDGSIYLTLINKNYGSSAFAASVSLTLPDRMPVAGWQRMDLVQIQLEIAAKTGIDLGDDSIDSQGAGLADGTKSKVTHPAS